MLEKVMSVRKFVNKKLTNFENFSKKYQNYLIFLKIDDIIVRQKKIKGERKC